MEYVISQKDTAILRELAKKQLSFYHEECNQERIRLWYEHNDLRGERPMVHLEMGTFAQEILPQRLQCEGEFARQAEAHIYSSFLNQELFDDDRVTPGYYALTYDTWFELFNIRITETMAKNGDGSESVGREFQSVISDLEEDWDRLGTTDFGVDVELTLKKKAVLEECFGDILPVKLQMDCLYSVPTQKIVHFMKMEDMMFAMYDYPELFKEMMGRIADDTCAYYRYLEDKHLILPTTAFEGVGQGTWAFTRQLPGEEELAGRPFTTRDVWGFMDSQETVGISPDMFEEFIFPCYQKIASNYGLLSYGCCEPVDPVWDRCISRLDNLRKVSVSPWCNEEFMGERLRGSKVIFHRKPSPNYLGVGTNLDEDAFRQHICTSLKAARGCRMEITQRDVYTINHDINKARRYVEIIREEITNHWNQ